MCGGLPAASDFNSTAAYHTSQVRLIIDKNIAITSPAQSSREGIYAQQLQNWHTYSNFHRAHIRRRVKEVRTPSCFFARAEIELSIRSLPDHGMIFSGIVIAFV